MTCKNFEEASDEINELFLDAWTLNTPSICGYVPQVYWKGLTPDQIPSKTAYWAKVGVYPVNSPQTALGMGTAPQGNRRFTTYGNVIVQVMCPANLGDAYQIGKRLSQVAQSAFRRKSTPSNVWFRDARINPLDQKEGFERFNIVADFQYDEIA